MLIKIGQTPITTTIQTAYAETVMFTPVTHQIHKISLKSESENVKIVAMFATYASYPIDSIIQSIAMLCFTATTHFRDIKANFQNKEIALGIAKIPFSLVSIPTKLLISSAVSAGFIFNAMLGLVFPLHAIFNSTNENSSERFFKMLDEYEFTYKKDHGFSIDVKRYLSPPEYNFEFDGYFDSTSQLNELKEYKTIFENHLQSLEKADKQEQGNADDEFENDTLGFYTIGALILLEEEKIFYKEKIEQLLQDFDQFVNDKLDHRDVDNQTEEYLKPVGYTEVRARAAKDPALIRLYKNYVISDSILSELDLEKCKNSKMKRNLKFFKDQLDHLVESYNKGNKNNFQCLNAMMVEKNMILNRGLPLSNIINFVEWCKYSHRV